MNRKTQCLYEQIADQAEGADGWYRDNLSATAQLVHLITEGIRQIYAQSASIVSLLISKRGAGSLRNLSLIRDYEDCHTAPTH